MQEERNTRPRKRTRGPRKPHERARDAARSTATLFENLPSDNGGLTDEFLKPLGKLIRFRENPWYEMRREYVPFSVVQQLEELEASYLAMLVELREILGLMPADDALEVELALSGVRRELRREKERIAAALQAQSEGSPS